MTPEEKEVYVALAANAPAIISALTTAVTVLAGFWYGSHRAKRIERRVEVVKEKAEQAVAATEAQNPQLAAIHEDVRSVPPAAIVAPVIVQPPAEPK